MLLIHSSAMDPCDYCHFNHHIALTSVQDRPENCVEGIEMCEPCGCHPEGDVFKGQKVKLLQDEAIHLKIPVPLREPTMWVTCFLLRERIALFQMLSATVRLVANFFSEAPCPRPCHSWRDQATRACRQCLIEHETYPLGSCQHFQGSCSPKSLAGEARLRKIPNDVVAQPCRCRVARRKLETPR